MVLVSRAFRYANEFFVRLARPPITVFCFGASPVFPQAETLQSDALAVLTTSYKIPAVGAAGNSKAEKLASEVELSGGF